MASLTNLQHEERQPLADKKAAGLPPGPVVARQEVGTPSRLFEQMRAHHEKLLNEQPQSKIQQEHSGPKLFDWAPPVGCEPHAPPAVANSYVLLPNDTWGPATICVPTADIELYANQQLVPLSIVSKVELLHPQSRVAAFDARPAAVALGPTVAPCGGANTTASVHCTTSAVRNGEEQSMDSSIHSYGNFVDVELGDRLYGADSSHDQAKKRHLRQSGHARKRARKENDSENVRQPELGELDVALGRGSNNYECKGNLKFRNEVVPRYAEKYKAAEKCGKAAVAQEAFDFWRVAYPNARFVTRLDDIKVKIATNGEALKYIKEHLSGWGRKRSPGSAHNTQNMAIGVIMAAGAPVPCSSPRQSCPTSRQAAEQASHRLQEDIGIQRDLTGLPAAFESIVNRLQTEFGERLKQDVTVLLNSHGVNCPNYEFPTPDPFDSIGQNQEQSVEDRCGIVDDLNSIGTLDDFIDGMDLTWQDAV
jgi:hypothetical protein